VAYSLIAFDLDGTLINSEARTIPNLIKVFNTHYNLPITAEHFLNTYHGMAGPRLIDRINADYSTQIIWEEFAPIRFAALEVDVREHGFEPAPGALQMLRRVVAEGQQICIVSNSNPKRIALSLELTHGQRQHGLLLPALFEGHIISGTDPAEPSRQSKPAPDAYLAAAEYYRTTPEQCLAVEDSVTGVEAAVAAGFECWGYIGLNHAPNAAENLKAAGATHIFTHWDAFKP
jgi:beta-phosphoglucomutase-like phosphatase (HAD superfamily)